MEERSSNGGTILALLRESFSGFLRDEGMRLSAALAYYSAFSIAPVILIVLAMAGSIFDEEAVSGALYGELRRDLGPSGAMIVEDMVAHAHKPGANIAMSLVGLGLLLFGAAGFFGELKSALNAIWNIAPADTSGGVLGMIKDRFLSFSMVLGTGFLMLVSMMFSTVLQAVSNRVGEIASIPAPVWAAVGGVTSFALITLLFAAIFKVLPDVKIRWREVWVGAAFTSGLFVAGKTLLAWYLGREATVSAYGAAGAFVVVLMWLHYSSAILLFGAEFTQNHAKARGFEIVGRKHGRRKAVPALAKTS